MMAATADLALRHKIKHLFPCYNKISSVSLLLVKEFPELLIWVMWPKIIHIIILKEKK